MPKYKLICFDLDGTLVKELDSRPYWGTLNRTFHGDDRVDEERMEAFNKGELSYKEWVDLDIGDFQQQGRKREELAALAKQHQLFPNTMETLNELKARGFKLAIISGSLNVLVETLFPEDFFDDTFNNVAFFDEQGLIMHWEETIFDQGTKHKALQQICKRENIPLEETIFVGDGENDIDILKEAGLGIAFNAKNEKVKEAADVVIEGNDLRKILEHII